MVSVSRSGSKPTKWADGQSWVEQVSWTKGDPLTTDLSSVFSGATAVISCVGVIGGSDEEMEKGNGDVNVAAAGQVGAYWHYDECCYSTPCELAWVFLLSLFMYIFFFFNHRCPPDDRCIQCVRLITMILFLTRVGLSVTDLFRCLYVI